MRVAIIGGGYIGTVIASVMMERGASIVVVEKNFENRNLLKDGKTQINEPNLQDLLKSGHAKGKLQAVESISQIGAIDCVLVTVGTPMDKNRKFDGKDLEEVFLDLSSHIKRDVLVLLKSTVEPGTSDFLYAKYLKGKTKHFAFSPERLSEGSAIKEFKDIPIVIGGINKESTLKATQFWQTFGFNVLEVSNSTVAELVKLSNNAWIDLNIAFGHELAKICDAIGIDVLEVIAAANSLKKGSSYVNILTPSIGVGGYCLTKDPLFLRNFAKTLGLDFELISSSRNINDNSPTHLFLKLTKKVNIKKAKILVLGVAFKNNTGDTRFSPVLKFIKMLIDNGADTSGLKWYDPLVVLSSEDNLNSYRIDELEYQNFWDVIVVGANHDVIPHSQLNNLKKLLNPAGVICDGRYFYSKDDILELKNSGFTYLGVGR